MMTEAQLSEIRRRCDAATPGPWTFILAETPEGREFFKAHDHIDTWALVGCQYGGRPPADVDWILGELGDDDPMPPDSDDQAFIAAARTDIPALLAEIDEILRQLAAMTERAEKAAAGWEDAEMACANKELELAPLRRLRAAVRGQDVMDDVLHEAHHNPDEFLSRDSFIAGINAYRAALLRAMEKTT